LEYNIKYLHNTNKFRWYKKWNYNAVDKLFNITLKDNNGKIYESYKYSILPSVGLFETFQIREINEVDLNQIESLSISISLDNDYNNNIVTTEIFNKGESNLIEVK